MFYLEDSKLYVVKDIVSWYREACNDPKSKVLPHPTKYRWKSWDNDRLWCSIFFSIGVKGGSKAARDYIEPIEKGYEDFELKVFELTPLDTESRMRKIWEFGRGNNRLGKALGRFFSRPENFGRKNGFERNITDAFSILEKHGFMDWFYEIDSYSEDREKAKAMEEFPGVGLKVSRDFLNDIGMTDSLIALDLHVLKEMQDNWGWSVPSQTPTDRPLYEAIEDGVRNIARRAGATVLEIDKAIYFGRMTDEYIHS